MNKTNKAKSAKEADIVKDETTQRQEEQSSKQSKRINVSARAKKKADLAVPLIADFIILAMGICMLLWPQNILRLISMIIGVIFLVYAGYNIIKYVRIEESDKKTSDVSQLITGIAIAIAGLFLIFQAGSIEAFFSILIGIILTISGILNLQDALTIKSDNKTPLILALVTLICGILCLFGKLMPINIMVCFVGIILIVYSLADIMQSSIIYKNK